MMQVFKWWLHGGNVRMSLKETVYEVNNHNPFLEAVMIEEDTVPIVKTMRNVVDVNDDDIPF